MRSNGNGEDEGDHFNRYERRDEGIRGNRCWRGIGMKDEGEGSTAQTTMQAGRQIMCTHRMRGRVNKSQERRTCIRRVEGNNKRRSANKKRVDNKSEREVTGAGSRAVEGRGVETSRKGKIEARVVGGRRRGT